MIGYKSVYKFGINHFSFDLVKLTVVCANENFLYACLFYRPVNQTTFKEGFFFLYCLI